MAHAVAIDHNADNAAMPELRPAAELFPALPKAAPGKLSSRSRAHLAHWLAIENQWSLPKAHSAINAYVAWLRAVAADIKAGRRDADAVPVPPNATVATVWGVHVLYSDDYLAWCASATGGRYIHHTPGAREAGGAWHLAHPRDSVAAAADGSPALSAAFRERLESCLRQEHAWSEATARQHVAEYEAWWRDAVVPALVELGPAGVPAMLPPSFEVDDVWHAHVQHTREYAAWCAAQPSACFVSHAPAVVWIPDVPSDVRRPDRHAERKLSMISTVSAIVSIIIGGPM